MDVLAVGSFDFRLINPDLLIHILDGWEKISQGILSLSVPLSDNILTRIIF